MDDWSAIQQTAYFWAWFLATTAFLGAFVVPLADLRRPWRVAPALALVGIVLSFAAAGMHDAFPK